MVDSSLLIGPMVKCDITKQINYNKIKFIIYFQIAIQGWIDR